MRGVQHQFTVAHRKAAVHDHGLHANGVLIGILESGKIRDRGGIEDRAGSGKLNSRDKWIFRATAA